jgi:hypothetical protein
LILTLRVALKDVRPQVWRRLRVPASFTLADLHGVLQVAMGWRDEHLHLFRVGGVSYTHMPPQEPDDEHDERGFPLSRLAGKGTTFTYEYDLGDGWLHDVVVEDVDPNAADAAATCLTGERACPPEGCGGPFAYTSLVAILADPAHDDHGEVKAWLGDFDPAAFDLAAINAALRSRT